MGRSTPPRSEPGGRPKADVLFITDVPLTPEHPAGFSPRAFHLANALADQWVTDVLALHRVVQPMFEPVMPLQGVRAIYDVRIGEPPASPGQRIRRAASRLFTVQPSFSRGRDNAELRQLAGSLRASVTVIHLPYLAYLAKHLRKDTEVVFLLEEAWERVHASGALSPFGRLGVLVDRWRVPRLYRSIDKRAALVAVISEAERAHFARFISPDKIVVFPHGVDSEALAPSPESPKTTDVLVVGDMRQSRNLHPVLELLAASRGPNASRDWRWTIVGPAPADRIGHAGNVTWTGYVPSLLPYYRSARVAVVPQMAGTGVKGTLLQAWATGVPVVASRFSADSTGATSEEDAIVGDGAAALVEMIGRVLSDKHLSQRLARNGRARATNLDLQHLSREFAQRIGMLIHHSPDGDAGPFGPRSTSEGATSAESPRPPQ